MADTVPTLYARDTMSSEATLVFTPETFVPSTEPYRRSQTGATRAAAFKTIGFPWILLKLMLLWMNLILLPLIGWTAAGSTLFLFMRALPFSGQFEGFIRLTYYVIKTEIGSRGLYAGSNGWEQHHYHQA